MEEPSWYHLRVLRSLKNVFQFRWADGCAVDVEEVVEDVDEGEEIDAYRTGCEVGLKLILRFASVTRRLGADEVSFDRSVEGEVAVVYVQGVKSDSWSRQPIAAVRRVGAVHSMVRDWGEGRGLSGD
jgi:hypothetical protein